ncbi:uncharacterized protein LOC143259834 [Megalopta genalis]|uniref:uncharacterized protein LOC143259834 n=1 Tax=Megalopta genalis TaxID=115081 RepID=UPI003FD1BD0E
MPLPRHCSVIGFADDVALLVAARGTDRVVSLTGEALARIHAWFRSNHLELAEEKTEVLHLTGRKTPEALQLALGSVSLRGSGCVRYLGLLVEGNQCFRAHARWDAARHGRWTHRLIPNISEWIQWGPKILSFLLTQFLSGHGCFAEYLSRMGFRDSDLCLACGLEPDPEHALLGCARFAVERDAAERAMGVDMRLNNFVALLRDERTRAFLAEYVTDVAKCRENIDREDRRRGGRRARNPGATHRAGIPKRDTAVGVLLKGGCLRRGLVGKPGIAPVTRESHTPAH